MIEPPRHLAQRIAALALWACALAAPTIGAAQIPYLQSGAAEPKYTAIVLDARSGEVLYAERADSPRYPASVTKLMTFYLAFEALAAGRLRLNDELVVSPLAAAQPPTKLGLRAGESIAVEDALHAMAVHSANDMAVAVAERVGGTQAQFAALMTMKAQQLGMANTRYVNANGLPDSRQITTARDIAILTRAILRDFPQYYGFFSQQEFNYRGKSYVNTNHLLGKMPGVDGLKTGFTNAAGYNLAASAMRNGNRLIAVVMGGSSGPSRNENVEGLLLTGFDVLERRARGEKIEVAQNLFEAAPSYRYVPPSRVGQGDTEDDPIDVVLTGRAIRPAAMTVANSMPSARTSVLASLDRSAPYATAPVAPPRAPASPARKDTRDWWVQVGEFKNRREARAQIEGVSRRFSQVFDNAAGSVDADGAAWRARFSGFSEATARSACSTISARGIPCAVRGPA